VRLEPTLIDSNSSPAGRQIKEDLLSSGIYTVRSEDLFHEGGERRDNSREPEALLVVGQGWLYLLSRKPAFPFTSNFARYGCRL